MVLVALATAGFVWWHFHTTPPFAEHVRTHAVSQERFDARLTPGTTLAATGKWSQGDRDPFAIADDDAAFVRDEARCELEVRREGSVLFHVVMELAIAEERATGVRRAIATRTVDGTTAPELRSVVRIYLHDREHLLEDGAGAVTFDVLLGAGSGPADVAVVAASPEQLVPLPAIDPRPRGLVAAMAARLWSHVQDRPVEGLLHHVRWSTPLSWRRSPEGVQQPVPAPIDLLHEASTYEYSYEIVARVAVRGATTLQSREIRRAHQFTWNGTLW